MDAEMRRALLDLLGEGDCCCCCEEREEAGQSVPTIQADLVPLALARPARPGTNPRTGQPDMPALKLRPVFDDPFIPPIPSFDSPQRPGFWGVLGSGGGGEA